MKKMVVFTMLIAMSASLIAPSVAVDAADKTVEILTDEDPAEEEDGTREEKSEEKIASDEVSPEEDWLGSSTDEELPEKDKGQEATITDTVMGFEFSDLVFGETLSAALTDHVQSISEEFDTIYDAERDLIDFAVSYVESVDEESASDPDYIASIKLQIAKMFEKAYGDDAFEAAIKIREEILADNNFEADFSECKNYDDLDIVYLKAEGMIDSPSDFWNYMNYPEDYEDRPEDDNNNPGDDADYSSGEENDASADAPANILHDGVDAPTDGDSSDLHDENSFSLIRNQGTLQKASKTFSIKLPILN